MTTFCRSDNRRRDARFYRRSYGSDAAGDGPEKRWAIDERHLGMLKQGEYLARFSDGVGRERLTCAMQFLSSWDMSVILLLMITTH